MSGTTLINPTAIDQAVDATQSVVLRYRNALRFESDAAAHARSVEHLEAASIREGMRLFPLFRYRGVDISVLDETSMMHTGTLKSIDGCVTAARCRRDGHRAIVFETGGNTGTALTVYGQRAGVETFCFVPTGNLGLLDSKAFASPTARLIAVDDPREVKSIAGEFAARENVFRVPRPQWRTEASMFIGCFLLEHLLEHPPFDFVVQTISAAFAPLGIYRVLHQHQDRLGRLPRFLGVQQEVNCAMLNALNGATDAQTVASTANLLSKAMYDGRPQTYGTVEELRKLLDATGGTLTTVNRAEFEHLLEGEHDGHNVLERLADNDLNITMRDGEAIEKAGLLALRGAIKHIDAGHIEAGRRVLVCLTGGAGCPDGQAVPDCQLSAGERSLNGLLDRGVGR